MPDITLNIVIPDAWVARVQAALGVSTKAEAEAWVRERMKAHVVSFEAQQANETAQGAVDAAIASQIAAADTAAQDVEANLTLG